MKTEVIYQEDDLLIKRHEGIPEAAMNFLDEIAWGTEGALYEHKNTREHAQQIPRPTLLALYRGEQVLATVLFANTPVWVQGQEFNCYYIRYFAASPSIRGQGLIKRYSAKIMQLIRENEAAPTIFFAVIERDNKASYLVVESVGYADHGTIKTMGFSRFFPQAHPDVAQIRGETGRETIRELLRNQYGQHALVQFNSLFLRDHYFVIREEGKIVAGCQYHRAHWVVRNMKGPMGWVTMNVVPFIPLLNQLFNPQRFEFLVFEGIYCQPGYEDKLYQLFESLLVREKLKSSMFWMGETCPVRRGIEAKGKLGLIHTFVKGSDATVMASFENMSAEERRMVQEQPLFVSGFDFI
jgi:GNAT superfamily N-acetyltransferase